MEEKSVINYISEAKSLITDLEEEIHLLNGNIEDFMKKIFGEKWETIRHEVEAKDIINGFAENNDNESASLTKHSSIRQ